MAAEMLDIEKTPNELKAEAMLQKLQSIGAKVFFEKQLTSSDVSASGRVVVPKAIAEQYMPKLEVASGMELDIEDVNGRPFTLKFRFWINNQSRMYLLEGTAELQHSYGLKMGDVLIFAQKEDKTIVLAGRPATRHDIARKPPVRKVSPVPGAPRPSGRPGGKDGAQRSRKKSVVRPYGVLPSDVEPPIDGVFRAMPSVPAEQASSVKHVNGKWVASLNLAGEVYQALFESESDAKEAYHAAAAGGAAPSAG